MAVLAGLASRERSGRGVCIEAPMFESMVSFLLVELLAGETFEPALGEMGYHRLSSPFRKPFETRDGYVSIIPYSDGQWRRFLMLIGRSDLVEDGTVLDPARRSRNINMLYGLVADVAPSRTTAEWLELMRENDIPCANVNRLEDLLEHPHLRDVGMFRRTEHPTEKRLRSVRTPFNVPDAEEAADRPAPNLGDDGEAVLREAGFTASEIESTVKAGGLWLPGR